MGRADTDPVHFLKVVMSLSVGSIILGFGSKSLVQRLQPRTLIQLFLVIVAVGVV